MVVMITAALAWSPALGEDDVGDEARPRIGLALGGGGARGMAHIGVLRVLEELHIPVDCIAGTSMGAVVGSIYALGLAPDEIEAIVTNIDWGDIFADKVDRQKRSFRRKQDDQSYLLGVEFGLTSDGFAFPKSISEGQNLAFALPVPELHTEGRDSFDDLPIPFRAVATDLETGKPVVLDHGNLFRAVRASMTVPLAFPPIEVDGRLLVDGSISLNDPVSVVRDMGADIVIAISVDEFPEGRDRQELEHLKEYVFQLLAVVLQPQVRPELDEADLVIHVPMPDVHMDDFLLGEQAVAAGEAATREQRQALEAFAVTAESHAALRTEVAGRRTQQWRFDEMRLDNRSRVSDAWILHLMRADDILTTDLQQLRGDLEKLYDLGVFESVEFDVDTDGGRNIVTVRTREKSYAPNIFHVGAAGAATLRGDTQFSMFARLTRLEMNGWGGEWRNDFGLGTDLLVDSEFYQPMGLGRHWFVSGRGHLSQTPQYIYDDQSRVAIQHFREASLGFDVGLPLGVIGELRTGLRWGGVQSSVVTGQSPLESFDGKLGSWESLLRYDLLDDADFPRAGGIGKLEFGVSGPTLGARDTYERLLGTWTEYFSWRRATGFWSLAGGSSFDSDLPPQEQFLLGGFTSFAGYSPGQLRGNVLGTVRLGSYVSLSNPLDFIATQWYAGLWGDVGNVWPDADAVALDDMRYGGALFVGADTIFGPAFVTGSLATEGGANVYVTLGLQVGVQH